MERQRAGYRAQKAMHKKHSVAVSDIHKYVSGIPFPAGRRDVIEYARNGGAGDGVIDILQTLPNRDYKKEWQIINSLIELKKIYENPK